MTKPFKITENKELSGGEKAGLYTFSLLLNSLFMFNKSKILKINLVFLLTLLILMISTFILNLTFSYNSPIIKISAYTLVIVLIIYTIWGLISALKFLSNKNP